MHPALTTFPAWAGDKKNGIIYDLPDTAYHATKALIGKHSLDIFARSPAHYYATLDAEDEARTDALNIGSAFHVAVLEPDLYKHKVLVLPDLDMRSSKNRDLRDRIIADDGEGKVHLKAAHEPLIEAMAKSVRQHPAARKLLARGRPEVTAYWTDPETGLRGKSRADWLSDLDGVFVDLKSALSAAPGEFARAAANNRYHVQDAYYSRAFEENGIHIEHFVFIVVEKEPPYVTSCFQLDVTARLKGEELYMDELRRMAECRAKNHWPGYGDGVIDLSLPGWATMTEAT
jgi:exodeoxyribonuclease VIII